MISGHPDVVSKQVYFTFFGMQLLFWRLADTRLAQVNDLDEVQILFSLAWYAH